MAFSMRRPRAKSIWFEGLFDKLTEETKELRHEVAQYPAPGPNPHARGRSEERRVGKEC